jgi:putative hemolysin
LFSVRLEESPAVDVAEEVRSLALQSEQEGLIEESEKRMIEGVVSLPDVPVTRIMTPRTLMVALNATATVGQAYEVLLEKGLSRVPVYEETLDNVVGLLFAKDLLKVCSAGQADTTPVRSLMREAHFIPETKLVSQLLQEMRGHKVHMAIVLDEYGGTAGLVTHQDILEEIVGEIRDEFDRDLASPIKRVNDTTIEADALTRVDRVNALLRTKLPECDDYETVSGLLMYHLGRIPAAGERFDHGNLRVTVLEGSPRRPQRVRIEVRPRPVAVP